jgi:hypothetical protein
MLGIQLSIESKALLSKGSKFLVGLMAYLLLLSNESLLVGDLLSKIEVHLVINT